MFTSKTLVALFSLLSFLLMAAALPQDPATTNMLAPAFPDNNAGNKVADPATGITVNLYKDKNAEHNVVIDPDTCKGKAEIALMKWRSHCKTFEAMFRFSCWTDAPSESKCCPLSWTSSCKHYWPTRGEWQDCLRMREECGKECDWQSLAGNVQWCWEYAPDI